MKVTGVISMRLFKTGSYDPNMGHSSNLFLTVRGSPSILNGINDDFEGGIKLCVSPMQVAGAQGLISETRGSKICFLITSVSIGVDYRGERVIEVTGDGKAEGSQGSIFGGIACHADWEWTEIESVSGRFGSFSGEDCLEKYNNKKGTHRSQFYFWDEERGNVLTPYAQRLTDELGWNQQSIGSEYMRNGEKSMPISQWADNALDLLKKHNENKARAERAKKYKSLSGKELSEGWDVKFHLEHGKRAKWELVSI